MYPTNCAVIYVPWIRCWPELGQSELPRLRIRFQATIAGKSFLLLLPGILRQFLQNVHLVTGRSALNHPYLLFTVDELDDASDGDSLLDARQELCYALFMIRLSSVFLPVSASRYSVLRARPLAVSERSSGTVFAPVPYQSSVMLFS